MLSCCLGKSRPYNWLLSNTVSEWVNEHQTNAGKKSMRTLDWKLKLRRLVAVLESQPRVQSPCGPFMAASTFHGFDCAVEWLKVHYNFGRCVLVCCPICLHKMSLISFLISLCALRQNHTARGTSCSLPWRSIMKWQEARSPPAWRT